MICIHRWEIKNSLFYLPLSILQYYLKFSGVRTAISSEVIQMINSKREEETSLVAVNIYWCVQEFNDLL